MTLLGLGSSGAAAGSVTEASGPQERNHPQGEGEGGGDEGEGQNYDSPGAADITAELEAEDLEARGSVDLDQLMESTIMDGLEQASSQGHMFMPNQDQDRKRRPRSALRGGGGGFRWPEQR